MSLAAHILFPLYVATSLLSAATQVADKPVIGDWYEDTTYGGHRTIAVGHFKGDGTFSVDFRTCLDHGNTLDHTDTGHWTYGGGKLRMTTETHGGFWVYDIEDYITQSNDGRIWVYKSVAGPGFREFGPIVFRDIRVTRDSKVPACELTT